jgi:hypothetical protein
VAASGHWTPPHAYAVTDTLPVEIAIDIDGDGPVDVHATIDGVPVTFDSVRVTVHLAPLPFGAFAEAAWIGDHPEIGGGAAWQPLHPWGYRVGPCVSTDCADWLAVGGRISRSLYSTLDAGGEIGYRIGDNAGLHLGISGAISF